jgi:hypothetical protein
MQRLLLRAAAVAVATGLGAAGALAGQYDKPMPGVAVYGPLHAAPPAGMVPPASAPAGYHYEWVYGYSREGVYKAHWEALRNS